MLIVDFQGLHVLPVLSQSNFGGFICERVIRKSVDLPPTGSRDSPQRPRGDRTHINPSETTVPNPTHTHTLRAWPPKDVANTHTLHCFRVGRLSYSCAWFVSSEKLLSAQDNTSYFTSAVKNTVPHAPSNICDSLIVWSADTLHLLALQNKSVLCDVRPLNILENREKVKKGILLQNQRVLSCVLDCS